jgi:Aspartyl protease
MEEEEDEADVAAARAQLRTSRIEEVIEPPASQSQPQEVQEVPVPARAPEHPFRYAKDASYTPPSTKNVGAQDKVPSAPYKRADPAYRTLPPIHDPAIAATVFQRAMEAPITITQRELLSLSPEVRSQVRDTTTTRRIPNKDNIISQNLYEDQDDIYYDRLATIQPVTTFALVDAYNRPIPHDAFVVEDEIESYYRSLGTGEDPDLNRLIVSGDSSAIRSVQALIDNSHRVECILDSGCQIIAMSEAICHQLGLAYDPSIVLHMQSANGTLDQSLGLSRNVPFQIATITIYLQVHVIGSPAYDVLLGRPFDVLTESVVRNFANEDQTITIQDPNTGRRVTVPTFTRTRKEPKCTHPRHGELSRHSHNRQGF